MRVAVLGSTESWYLRDLQRAAAARHEVVPVGFRQLVGMLGSDAPARGFTPSVNVADFDALLVRTMPPGSLEQVVFRMDVLGRLEAAGKVIVNPPRAIEAAVDKYLTSAKLDAAGLLTPPTIVCQTVDDAMQAFAALGGDVVVKPLFGAEGRGITRLHDDGLAERAFGLLVQLGAVLYVQQFIPHHGSDLRVLVVGQHMWAIERSNTLDWRTNVSRGATAQPAELTSDLAETAPPRADAIGAPLAGVDLLPGRDGRLYAIEVNAVPGWQALSRTLKVDIAGAVLDLVQSQSLVAKREGVNGPTACATGGDSHQC